MDYRLDEEQEAFVAEVRRFLDEELSREVVREVAGDERMGPHAKAFLRKMATKRWLSVSWPEQWGGLGRSPIERYLLSEELAYHGAPGAATSNAGGRIVAPVVIMFGTPEQKDRFLPPIARGEIDFALGYTEPEAGSDPGGMMQTRAVRDGDDYVLNGTKMFISGAATADFIRGTCPWWSAPQMFTTLSNSRWMNLL